MPLHFHAHGGFPVTKFPAKAIRATTLLSDGNKVVSMCSDRDHRDSNVLFPRRFKVFAAQKSAIARYRGGGCKDISFPASDPGGIAGKRSSEVDVSKGCTRRRMVSSWWISPFGTRICRIVGQRDLQSLLRHWISPLLLSARPRKDHRFTATRSQAASRKRVWTVDLTPEAPGRK
jgi:hypothetical protein